MSIFIRPCKGPLTSYYGKRVHPVTGVRGKMHHGLDYGNTPYDNTIVSVGDGHVSMARYMSGYGNMIVTRHNVKGKYYDVVYAHLSKINVRVNQKVKAGQPIGVKGNTGVGTGVHLHLEVHVNKWTGNMRNTRNPALFIFDSGVYEEQDRLRYLGYKITPDGYYGSGTERVVMQFQKKNKLTPDGFLGHGTRLVLKNQTKNYKPNNNEKPKEVNEGKAEDDMSKPFDTGVTVLNKAAETMISNAIKEGILSDDKWLEDYKKGKISAHKMLGLLIQISNKKREMFKPKTATLVSEVEDMISNAIKDGTLNDDKWLKDFKSGKLTNSDVLALKLLIDERRRTEKNEDKK